MPGNYEEEKKEVGRTSGNIVTEEATGICSNNNSLGGGVEISLEVEEGCDLGLLLLLLKGAEEEGAVILVAEAEWEGRGAKRIR